MQIIFTVPDEKVNDLRNGFLRARPVPIDPETEEPKYADLEWIKMNIRAFVFRIYESGKREIAKDSAVVDKDIIT